MSKERGGKIPDVEVSGEWDHGMLDPVFSNQNAADDVNNLSFQDIKKTVLKVEGQLEGAIRTVVHSVEHAVEDAVEEMKLHHSNQKSVGDELPEIVDVGVAMRARGE